MSKELRISIIHFIGISILHLGSLYSLFCINWTFELFLVFFISYEIKILGITVGYHRYFTHKSFEANKLTQISLALAGTWAGQGPLGRWVIQHIKHHRHSDKMHDPHSPITNSFFYSHMGWLLNPKNFMDFNSEESRLKLSKEVNFISKRFNLLFLSQIPLLYAIGGSNYVLCGFFPSTLLCLHSTFFVNSICHLFGTRTYETKDNSKNNLFVAILTNGEGWHNNHHFSPSSALHGWNKRQIDVSYIFISALEKIGYVKNVKKFKMS